jgi:ATPase family associated with various cellular activities (AAA)
VVQVFELALKAGITFIGVHTDDTVNLDAVLAFYAQPTILRKLTSVTQKPGPYIYWTDDPAHADPDLYAKFKQGEHQLIFVNVQSAATAPVMDCGTLPTPMVLLLSLLESCTGPDAATLVPLLKGLSLRGVEDVLRLTQARAGNHLPGEVRRTRMELSGGVQGLFPTDTTFDFYEPPGQLEAWLKLNKPFLMDPKVHPKLVPRGLLLDGSPGVGKSMAAKYIARELSVPLYRLDIATTLDKYIGVSEQRVAKILQLVDREEPCLLLIDEVEKIFSGKDETGVTQRILSQLLWWLAEHRSRVVTIMTTNKRTDLPPEMYRSGRVDEVMVIHRLSSAHARSFAVQVYKSVTIEPLPNWFIGATEVMFKTGTFSHAEVAETVYTAIKKAKVETPQLTNPEA